jgi:inorganic phosphate transporter, PiT family
MSEIEIVVYSTIITALFFDFVNGFHDSANSIATVVGTKVLKPLQAVGMAALPPPSIMSHRLPLSSS